MSFFIFTSAVYSQQDLFLTLQTGKSRLWQSKNLLKEISLHLVYPNTTCIYEKDKVATNSKSSVTSHLKKCYDVILIVGGRWNTNHVVWCDGWFPLTLLVTIFY